MANDTVTLALHGEVSLQAFAEAVQRFDKLVKALARDTGARKTKWQVIDLEVGSTLTTARGTGQDGQDAQERVEGVVRNFLRVGRALERHEPLDFSKQVRDEARQLTALLNGDVTAIRFETAEADATVRAVSALVPPEQSFVTYGAVEGRVQTLTSRGGLRFTLYDLFHDRAVSCYLAPGYEDQMRDAWGRRAVVEGRVSRDGATGRPLAIRSVTNVAVLREVEPSAYRGVRGISPSGGLSAEDAVRRIRDAR